MLSEHDAEAHARALELSRHIDEVDNAHRPSLCPCGGELVKRRDVLECLECGDSIYDELPRLESN